MDCNGFPGQSRVFCFCWFVRICQDDEDVEETPRWRRDDRALEHPEGLQGLQGLRLGLKGEFLVKSQIDDSGNPIDRLQGFM